MSEDSKGHIPIRQVQCTSNEQAFDEVAAGIQGLTNPMEASIGIWEKMVASREPDNPLSMHGPTAMRFVMVGNKSNMTKFNMTNHVGGAATSYKSIMDAANTAMNEEAAFKTAQEQDLLETQNSTSVAANGKNVV